MFIVWICLYADAEKIVNTTILISKSYSDAYILTTVNANVNITGGYWWKQGCFQFGVDLTVLLFRLV